MSFPNEFYSVLKKTAKVAPSFVFLAIAGCTVAYLSGVRSSDLGVFVAMPLVWLFSISRIFIALRPYPQPQKPHNLSKLTVALIVGESLALILASLFLVSGVSFWLMGLRQLAYLNYVVALVLFIIFVISILMTAVVKNILRTWKTFETDFSDVLLAATCYVLSLPTQISAMLRFHIFN